MAPCPSATEADFRAIYDAWFDPVCRWLRSLGGPDSDVEDLAQEVFVIVRRKLPGFDGQNLAGWLYRISWRVVANARRGAWFKHLFSRRSAIEFDALPHLVAGPADHLERKQAEAILYRLLDRLSEKRRTVLILSEIEGRSGDEIAGLLGVPVATVRTRLFHARKEFLELAGALRRGDVQ